MDLFSSADNALLVNGKSLTDIKMLLGQTPFYAYDSRLISERVKQLRSGKRLPLRDK
jgi:diaminopimelate decarboxylase